MKRAPRNRCVPVVLALMFASLYAAGQVVVSTVPAGSFPGLAAVDSTRNRAYVLNQQCGTPDCTVAGTLTVLDGSNNQTITTVNVGINPAVVLVNATTNKIYVDNECGSDATCQSAGTVTVIDGNTFATSTVNVGFVPGHMALNATTNQLYVVNMCNGPGIPTCTVHGAGTITVIDGTSLATQSVTVGYLPKDVAVDVTTNVIYVANNQSAAGLTGTVTVIDGSSLATQQVQAGDVTNGIVVDETTNKIYAANLCGNDLSCQTGSVTVIDGTTLATQSVATGILPYFIAVNPVTNKIYTANQCGDSSCTARPTVTIINGTSLSTSNVTVCSSGGESTANLSINTTTNKIYIPCVGTQPGQGRTVTQLDGATIAALPIAVGDAPTVAAINPTTNTIYVPNFLDNSISVIGGATKLQLVPITPCRLVDTRGSGGPLAGGSTTSFDLRGLAQAAGCADISSSSAYSLNITLLPQNGGPVSYLTLWPQGQIQPIVSTMNSPDGRNKANAAVVPAGVSGGVSVYVTNTANLIIDIDAYFAPSSQNTLAFYSVTPCRVIDTRDGTFPSGLGTPHLSAGAARDFPVLTSPCIPSGVTPVAYSLNFTAIPYPGFGSALGYLEVWPTGNQPANPVSTLNNPTGTYVANAAIVSAGTGGEITAFASNDTDLAVDINGYFAPVGGQNALSMYPTPPCRVFDTRAIGQGQPFTGTLSPPVDPVHSACSVPNVGQAYIYNATVVPSPTLPYLTLWPDGEQQPVVSTLNARDGVVTSNMAVVPNRGDGKTDAYASGTTQLILDISGYFAP